MASSASPAGAVPATLATTRKAFKSSVCVIPPPSCWKYIQKIRSHHDKVYRRWPPHVNLLYPFHVDSGANFGKASKELSAALSEVQPFEASLASADAFMRKRQCTVYAAPEPEKSLCDLHAACLGCFPDCDDTSKVASTGFTPHLSVGQFGRKKALAAVGEINAAWQSPQDCQAQPSSPQPQSAASSHGWSRKPPGPVLACDAGSGGGAPERVEEGSADDWMTDGAVLLSPGVWSSEDPPSPPQEGSAPGEAAAPAAEGTGHDS